MEIGPRHAKRRAGGVQARRTSRIGQSYSLGSREGRLRRRGYFEPSGSGAPSAASPLLRNYQEIGSILARQDQDRVSTEPLIIFSSQFNTRINILTIRTPSRYGAICTRTRLPTTHLSHRGNYKELPSVCGAMRSPGVESRALVLLPRSRQLIQSVDFPDARVFYLTSALSCPFRRPNGLTSSPRSTGGSWSAGRARSRRSRDSP